MPKEILTYGTLTHNAEIYGFIDVGVKNSRTYFPARNTLDKFGIQVGKQMISFQTVILADNENFVSQVNAPAQIDLNFGGVRYSGQGYLTAIEQAGVLDGHIVYNVAGQFIEESIPHWVINRATVSAIAATFGPHVFMPSINITPGLIVALTDTQGPTIGVSGETVSPAPIGSLTDVLGPNYWVGFYRANWCVDLDGWAEGFGFEGVWEFLPARIVNEVLCNLSMERIHPLDNAGYLFRLVPELAYLDRYLIEYDYLCPITSSPDELRVYGTDAIGSPTVVLNSTTPIRDAEWHHVEIDVNPPSQTFYGLGLMPIKLLLSGHIFYINNFRILRGDLAPIFIDVGNISSIATTVDPSPVTVELYTIGVSGADYTNIENFLTDHNTRDLVAEGIIIKGTFITDVVDSTWTVVGFSSATTDENHFFHIDGAGHKITYSGTSPREVLYNFSNVSIVIESLEFDLGGITIGGIDITFGKFHRINNCIAHNSDNAVGIQLSGFRSDSATVRSEMYNNLVYGFKTVSAGLYGIRISGTPAESFCHNNTVWLDGFDNIFTIGIDTNPATKLYNNISIIDPENPSPTVQICFLALADDAGNNISSDNSAQGPDSHINEDPDDLFRSPAGDDYTPKSSGVAFDGGKALAQGFNTDLNDVIRPQGDAWDVGAIEAVITVEEYTIGTGGDYTTIQAFVADHTSRDFIAEGVIVKGTLLNDLSIDGSLDFINPITDRYSYFWIDGAGFTLECNMLSASNVFYMFNASIHLENIYFDGRNNNLINQIITSLNSDFLQVNNCSFWRFDHASDVTNAVQVNNCGLANIYNNLFNGIWLYSAIGILIQVSTSVLEAFIYNNTAHEIINPGGTLSVFNLQENLSNSGECKNNVCGDISASGSELCFGVGGQYESSNNVSTDDTAPGTSSHINQIAVDLFEDPTGDFVDFLSTDFTPKSTGNLFDLGIPVSLVTDDVLGISRPQVSAFDIGSFELIPCGIFNGSNAYIDCTDNALFSFGNGSSDSPFSVSGWFYLSAKDAFRGLVNKITADYSNSEWRVSVTHLNEIEIQCIDHVSFGEIRAKSSGNTLDVGKWYHIVATYSGIGTQYGFNLYLNGSALIRIQSTSGTYNAMIDSNDPVMLGNDQGAFFAGKMRNIKIFGAELSPGDILQEYISGDLVANLIANYKLEADANDSGPNLIHGTNNNVVFTS